MSLEPIPRNLHRGIKSPVFMRVRRTAPCFTFNLPISFVNR